MMEITARYQRAAGEYPGYLPVRADLYARGWRAVADRPGHDDDGVG